jgi:hypothetical protein
LTVLLDDHLLRDWMVGPDAALRRAIGGEDVASTNLWYARLCRSAARVSGGALVGRLSIEQRRALVASLVALPADVTIVPMRDVAWPMGALTAEHSGLSTLGAEAVVAAEVLDARILTSSLDDGPGIRACCRQRRIGYRTVPR